MRRYVSVVAVLGVLVTLWFLAGCYGGTRPGAGTPGGESVVTLGAIAPLTGEGAQYGKWAQRGVELALQDVNEPGAKVEYKVVWEDSQLNPTKAVSALLKLADSDKVPLVLGPLTSGETIPCVAKANEKQVVVLSPTATSDKLVDVGPYFARVCPTNLVQADTAARFAIQKLGARSAYVLYEDIAYGTDLAAAFRKQFKALGGRIVGSDSFREGQTDYKSAIQKIKAAKPDVVYAPSNYTEAGTLLRQMAQLGVKTKVLGGDGSYGDELLRIAGPAAEGTYWTTIAWGTGESKAVADDFRKRYQQAYGEAPHQFAGLYYDAARVAFQAVSRPGMTGSEAREALLSLAPFNGATGTTKFTDRGQVEKSFAVYLVRGGKFEQVAP